MALGFQSPCLLSSCSFWRAPNQSAAWRDPAELGFPASQGAVEHYRSAGPDTRRFPTLPKAMPYGRGSLGTHARPCPILCRRRLQLAPAIRLLQVSLLSFCRGDAPHRNYPRCGSADILSPLNFDVSGSGTEVRTGPEVLLVGGAYAGVRACLCFHFRELTVGENCWKKSQRFGGGGGKKSRKERRKHWIL